MRIIMMTNTYLPHVGGVARSVAFFAAELRKRGHRVLVVAPEYGGKEKQNKGDEEDVLRIRALQKFNGSDFSVIIGTPPWLSAKLEEFQPQIVHSHHPFLLGSTALRTAAKFRLPLVFTHHTMYEQYTHYVPGNWPKMKQFAANLSTGYANLCDQVVAPSRSIAEILQNRGVQVPVSVIPTGIHTRLFSRGDGEEWRRHLGIRADAKVVGFVGRLAPEKNLDFLAEAVARCVAEGNVEIHFLVVGSGPSSEKIKQIFRQYSLSDRLHLAGDLQGKQLSDAYHAMDLFGFASKSETQGLVLAEAMAAGLPVVALDAPGAREVVEHGRNGALLTEENIQHFVETIKSLILLPREEKERMQKAARFRAEAFSADACIEKMISLYQNLLNKPVATRSERNTFWRKTVDSLKAEWEVISNYTEATTTTLKKNS